MEARTPCLGTRLGSAPGRVNMVVEPGTPAPDFEAEAHDGTVFRLSGYRGRMVILYFYPRAMTPGCTREAKRFNELLEEFERLGAVVAGVSTDPPERNKRFAEKLGLRFRLLSDPDGRIASLYGVLKAGTKRPSAERVTFVIDDSGVVREVIRGVRPAEKHADAALDVVRRLRGEKS